jgi:small-conductance mechanosensitive channel
MSVRKAVTTVLAAVVLSLFGVVWAGAQETGAKPAVPAAEPTAATAGDTADTAAVADQGDGEPAATAPKKDSLSKKWLYLLGSGQESAIKDSNMLNYAPRVPGNFGSTLGSIGAAHDGPGFWGTFFRSLIAIGLGFVVMLGCKWFGRKRLASLATISPPEHEALSGIWVGFFRSLPALLSLVVLAISATLIFLLLAGDVGFKGRMLFQALLGAVLIFWLSAIISRIIFSPDDGSIRPFEISDALAKPIYEAAFISFAVLMVGKMWVILLAQLGAHPQTVNWAIFILSSLVILIYAVLVYALKKPVNVALSAALERREAGWVRKQIASYWHMLAYIYLFVVWLIWIGQLITGEARQSGEFIISMLIVPIYFAISIVGKQVVAAVVDSLGLGRVERAEDDERDEAELEQEALERKQAIVSKVQSIFNLVVVAVLAIWLFSLWGSPLPFAEIAVQALFESLVALILALVVWRLASSYIERKLDDEVPHKEEQEEDDDSEFGGAVARGRSYTLLPMLRKVIGSVLVVMVALIVISSLGVNIGPLLAGAGVLGLAIGFGAQKLVSDVLSGFFFLLDDAFRVGEYIQAGSIRGTVEAITLRNVMLRHHLGMLQVVPHSDLGAITNYMRGGIVIKFPLEFPYDTNIDLVRKIIKKVGVAMLEDPEIGEDFIQPVKSQGVNEITNSVMVIRVKFTAKPGKQFVIKREAFRRITEALNAKGIYYAHRKVIVDFPEESSARNLDSAARQKAIQAGAAAAIAAEDQQKQEQAATKPQMGMD